LSVAQLETRNLADGVFEIGGSGRHGTDRLLPVGMALVIAWHF